MSWFIANQVSVTNGGTVVTVDSLESIINIQPEDGLIVGSFTPVEIKRAYVGGAGEQFIELTTAWGEATQATVPARAYATGGDFATATTELRLATSITSGNFKTLENFQTLAADAANPDGGAAGTVTFTNIVGTKHEVLNLAALTASAGSASDAWDQAVTDMETKDQTTYREAIESASGGKNTVFWDTQGNPNVMVWINKFNSEDINAEILVKTGVDLQLGTGTFPAFIRNGVELRGFWYGKYQASAGIGGGCSVIAGVQPKVSISYDTALTQCSDKGANWHLASNLEWTAVSYLSMAYGSVPRGNTGHGQAHAAKYETARRMDTLASGDNAGTGRSDCGTGPSAWSHDGTMFGVFDLVGNVWEFVGQLLLKEGQVVTPADNNPDLAEISWTSHAVYFDSVGAANSAVILNNLISTRLGTLGDSTNTGDSNINTWAATTKDVSYVANVLMRQMAIETASTTNLTGKLHSRNYGERAPTRGGSWSSDSSAGLGALYCMDSRTSVASNIGFRPALFE